MQRAREKSFNRQAEKPYPPRHVLGNTQTIPVYVVNAFTILHYILIIYFSLNPTCIFAVKIKQ